MDMEQLLKYYLKIMLMSAFLRWSVKLRVICNVYVFILYVIQDGWTPLMAASLEGHADIVQTLIEAKAQVNTQQEV